ncbi:phage head-binding domain-containing protein [Escherichia fergusonii]|uniref:phage head-binding domain-containing protein n=1 Tax=Escherichia fergusonii TaxID=564 RepID=UPI00210B2264|nr:phage head-binding domain-containing protein [Escherichia fergusonii]
MTDITANVIVSMPSQLFTMARSFKAVANGKIYIGKIDTDPVNPENQIQVYVENEDGSHVPAAQPIVINAAGFPVYNGQIAKFLTVQGHSMAVYDMYGVQQFYFPNVLKYDPDQLEQRLAAADGAKLSLSQVATAYGLDFSLGGVWTEGAVSAVDNWWWYENKVYTGGSGALPAAPAAPWYPIRPGHKLNLTDFITSKGSTDVLDVVDWQWAFDSAKQNAQAGYSGVISLDAREYAVTSSGYLLPKNVGLIGAKDAMMSTDLDGISVLYIDKDASSSDVIFQGRGGNELRNFGVFYAQQKYGTADGSTIVAMSEMLDTGVFFEKVPESSSDNTKGCILEGVSVCGGARIWKGTAAKNAAGEYDYIGRVSATPSVHGPSFQFGISTDLMRVKSIHLNGNVVSMYRSTYNVEIQTRGAPKKYTSAIGILIERMDGGVFEDVMTYGIPFAVVFGAVGKLGGTNAASANFVSCTFDATANPVYINSPAGAFGIQFVNCGFVFSDIFGDTEGVLIYMGDSCVEHHVQLTNIKVQIGGAMTYRPFRGTSGSTNNRVVITNAALTNSNDNLDSGTGNRISFLNVTKNLINTNFAENITRNALLMSSMTDNTIVRQSVNVSVAPGATYTNLAVTYSYTGWLSVPNVKTEVSAVQISGQSDSTLYTTRTYSRSATGCTVRVNLSTAAAAAGTVTVDLYIIGTVRGALTAV